MEPARVSADEPRLIKSNPVPPVKLGAALSRYASSDVALSVKPVVVKVPGVAATPVTGSFETGDTDAFVSAVSDLDGLRADRQPDGEIVLDAAPPAPE